MSGHQVTNKSEKFAGKMVYYEGSDTLYTGYALCYNVDATVSDSDPIPSAYRVEKPSATNLEHFAGVVSEDYAGKTGPCYLRIVEPDKMQKADAYIGVNTTADTTLLALVAGQYYLGGIGKSNVVVARAMATDATLGATPATGLVKFNPSTGDKLTRLKVGSSSAYRSVGTEAGVKFWELRTKSEDPTGADSRGLYWWHQLAGGSDSGEAARFMTVAMGAGTSAIHGVHNSISVSGAAATITGLGCANRATVMVPDQEIGTGTITAVQAEWYAEGDASAASGSPKSFIRCVVGGDATGVTTLQTDLCLMDLAGVTVNVAGTGGICDALAGDVAATHVLKILIGGVPYYILMRNAVT
jgi:hypothetical protein